MKSIKNAIIGAVLVGLFGVVMSGAAVLFIMGGLGRGPGFTRKP